MKKPKIVVAYSGGLDTSVMVRWLKEKYHAEIITATGNLGQEKELKGVREKALKTGASKVYIRDLTEEFVEHYCFPALRAGALYEQSYPMATSLGRPLIAKMLVEVARKEQADMIAHGCSGKGSDQVRFEVSNSNHGRKRSPTQRNTPSPSPPPGRILTPSMKISGERALNAARSKTPPALLLRMRTRGPPPPKTRRTSPNTFRSRLRREFRLRSTEKEWDPSRCSSR